MVVGTSVLVGAREGVMLTASVGASDINLVGVPKIVSGLIEGVPCGICVTVAANCGVAIGVHPPTSTPIKSVTKTICRLALNFSGVFLVLPLWVKKR